MCASGEGKLPCTCLYTEHYHVSTMNKISFCPWNVSKYVVVPDSSEQSGDWICMNAKWCQRRQHRRGGKKRRHNEGGRWERDSDCLCGGKRRCDSPLTPLITGGEDSVELCCKFLLPQCWVCLMLSPLYYSPRHYGHHTHAHTQTKREREKERKTTPCYLCLFNSLLQMSYCCLQNNTRPCVAFIFPRRWQLLSGNHVNC